MLPLKTPAVNLAGHPLRNRRLYKALVFGSAALSVAVAAGLAAWFLAASGRASAARTAATLANQELQALETERGRVSAETGAIIRKDKALVDQVNAVIARKSFSWTGFLGLLEDALPPRSYISRLLPLAPAEAGIAIEFRVVSAEFKDQNAFIDNLRAAGITAVQVKREALEGGLRVADMELRYERAR